MTLRIPFRRRRSRWDRLRDSVPSRKELRRRVKDVDRLRESLPDMADLRHRVEPLVQRMEPLVQRASSATQNVSLPEPPAYLQERLRLDRLATLGRKQPSRSEQILNANAPVWLVVAVALGGLLLGYGLYQMISARRAEIRDLESAAARIKEAWPSVQDDDIREAKGNIKRLSSVIGERTGEDPRTVRERLSTLTATNGASGEG